MDTRQDHELLELLAQKKLICDKINHHLMTKYKKYENMSSEVIDDNPYRYS